MGGGRANSASAASLLHSPLARVKSTHHIQQLLRRAGITFRDIRLAGGPSPSTMSRLLRGERAWRPEWVDAVAKLVGVTPETIASSAESPEPVEPEPHPRMGKLMLVPPPADAADKCDDEVLTVREAASFIKCTVSFLYNHSDVFPPAWAGGRRRYLKADLVAQLRATVGRGRPHAPAQRGASGYKTGTVIPGIQRTTRR